MRILVADDESALRNLYKQILEAEKYEVDIAEDGEKALEYLQKGGYNLILLDVQMPNMDGLAAVSALKRTSSEKPNGPIYFLTNNQDDITIAKSVALEVQGYLIKSQYTPDLLIKEIKRILDGEKSKNL